MQQDTQTLTARLIDKLQAHMTAHGHDMLSACRGQLYTPDRGGPIEYGLMHRSAEVFGEIVELFDQQHAPVALVWPMRKAGGIADSTSQSRFLAIYVKLSTGDRWAIIDHQSPLQWYAGYHPRALEMRRCLDTFRDGRGQ